MNVLVLSSTVVKCITSIDTDVIACTTTSVIGIVVNGDISIHESLCMHIYCSERSSIRVLL